MSLADLPLDLRAQALAAHREGRWAEVDRLLRATLSLPTGPFHPEAMRAMRAELVQAHVDAELVKILTAALERSAAPSDEPDVDQLLADFVRTADMLDAHLAAGIGALACAAPASPLPAADPEGGGS